MTDYRKKTAIILLMLHLCSFAFFAQEETPSTEQQTQNSSSQNEDLQTLQALSKGDHVFSLAWGLISYSDLWTITINEIDLNYSNVHGNFFLMNYNFNINTFNDNLLGTYVSWGLGFKPTFYFSDAFGSVKGANGFFSPLVPYVGPYIDFGYVSNYALGYDTDFFANIGAFTGLKYPIQPHWNVFAEVKVGYSFLALGKNYLKSANAEPNAWDLAWQIGVDYKL